MEISLALLLPVNELIAYVHVMDRPYCTIASAWLNQRSTDLSIIRTWRYITPRVLDLQELFNTYTWDYTDQIHRIELKVYPHAWSGRRWDDHIVESVVVRGDVGL